MFFLFRKFSGYAFTLIFLCTLSRAEIVKSEASILKNEEKKLLDSSYLDSNNELEDYIIDKGDNLFLRFFPAVELSDFYSVNDEGEIYLPRLGKTYVKGLTTSDLEKFLEEKYSKFLISPDINVNIAIFRDVNVMVSGEVRYPGLYKFSPYKSASIDNFIRSLSSITSVPSGRNKNPLPELAEETIKILPTTQNKLSDEFSTKSEEGNLTTITDVIRKSGGITSFSDLGRIEILREIPLSKGGGKKIAVINLNNFIENSDVTNDIRLFDGDHIFIPTLKNPKESQVPKSVLTGLSPRFIKVKVSGRVNNEGSFMLPLEGTLSDALDITGPIKPLSGKVILIRYNKDGTISKKKISYSSNAPRGSRRNPFVKEGDLITVTQSILGKTTAVLGEVTAPFLGIYTIKELYEDFNE